jgi:hypothetical protein
VHDVQKNGRRFDELPESSLGRTRSMPYQYSRSNVVSSHDFKVALQVIRANLVFFTDLGKNSDGGIEKKES